MALCGPGCGEAGLLWRCRPQTSRPRDRSSPHFVPQHPGETELSTLGRLSTHAPSCLLLHVKPGDPQFPRQLDVKLTSADRHPGGESVRCGETDSGSSRHFKPAGPRSILAPPAKFKLGSEERPHPACGSLRVSSWGLPPSPRQHLGRGLVHPTQWPPVLTGDGCTTGRPSGP